jgi:threonine dehydrogenase-like Zn-dependent dehydrogenase
MKSKDIILLGQAQATVKECEVSRELAHDEILLQADCSLISSGSETYHFIGQFESGMHWSEIKYPVSTGYAMVGKILDLNSGVSGFKAGDRVYSRSPHKQISHVQDFRLSLLPEDISSETAVWMPVLRTADHAVRCAEIQLGQTVVVVGLGIFGLCVVQYAYLAGAKKIIAIDPSSLRVELAKKTGATDAFIARGEDCIEQVRELTEAKMADVVFDCTGIPEGLQISGDLARRMAKIILISDTPEISKQAIGRDILMKYLTIHGVHINMNDTLLPHAFYPMEIKDIHHAIYEYLRQGRLKVNELVTHRLSPSEAAQIYYTLATDSSETAGIIIDWNKP